MVRSRVRTVVAVLVSGAAVMSATLASGAVAERAPVRQVASLEVPAVTYVNQKVVLESRFTPARNGRKVQLLVKQGRGWKVVDTGRQDRRGRATFQLAARRTGAVKVRTRAVAQRALPMVMSSIRKIRVKRDRVAIVDSFHALADREAALATYDPTSGRLMFDRRATPAIRNLAKGDLLTIPPTNGIASGALVEVTNARQTRRGVVARTASASLVDVVQNVPDDATSFAAVPTSSPEILWQAPGVHAEVVGGSPTSGHARLATLEGPTLTLSLSEEMDLTEGLALSQEGSFSITPMGQVELDMDWGDLKSYKVGVGAGTNLEYSLGVSRKWEGDRRLMTVRASFRAMIGWLPLWMDVTTDIVLTRSVEGKVVLRAVSAGSLVVGYEGDEDSSTGLTPNAYADVPEGDISIEPGVVVSAEAGPKLITNFSVYSAFGPELSAGVVAGAAVDSFPGGRECSLFVRADAGIGLAASTFFEKLTGKTYETSTRTMSASLKNSQLPCGDPVTTPTPLPTPNPTETPTGTPTPDPDSLRVLSSYLPQGYQHDDYSSFFVASEPGGTWRVASGALPQGVVLDPGGTLTGAPTGAPGTSTFTVEVEVDGRTASREFQITIAPATSYSDMDISGGEFGMPCGLSAAGDVSCWWHALFFNPDEGDASNLRYFAKSTIPGPFQTLDGTCGLRTDGSATCWTGSRYTEDFNDEIDVKDLPGQWRQVVGDPELGCGVRTNGTAACVTLPLGRDHGPTPGELDGTWASISLENGIVCGVRSNLTGACFPDGLGGAPIEVDPEWVTSRAGECGIDASRAAMCLIGGVLEPWQGMEGEWVALSSEHVCGIRPDGDLECETWFAGDDAIEGPWVSISGSCALKADGTGWCFGPNLAGEVGNGTRTEPTTPQQLPGTWTQLVSRRTQSCGLQTDGSGWCWGNSRDRPPNPWTPPIRLVPTRVQSGP